MAPLRSTSALVALVGAFGIGCDRLLGFDEPVRFRDELPDVGDSIEDAPFSDARDAHGEEIVPTDDATFETGPETAPLEGLTLTIRGSGGRVTSTPPGIDCPGTCNAKFPDSTKITLAVATVDGTLLRAWSGACQGTVRQCVLTAQGTQSVGVEFFATAANVVFATSLRYGAADVAISQCAFLARQAGLGGQYTMLAATTARGYGAILGGSQGFVRVDGVPVLDQVTAPKRLLNPIDVDELGRRLVEHPEVWTGLSESTATQSNCADWKSAAAGDQASIGSIFGGVDTWYAVGVGACDGRRRIYCVQTGKRALLDQPVSGGRRIFVARQATPFSSVADADALCQSHARGASLSGTYRAFVSTSDGSPAARFADLPANERIVRVDGQLVAIGSELLGGRLRSGIWQDSKGEYVGATVWTGAVEPTVRGLNCDGWTRTTGASGAVGWPASTVQWLRAFDAPCTDLQGVYCLETAPR
jgi:hypothetical protein